MILVTGGLGYLGGRISQHLVELGKQVRVASCRTHNSLREVKNGCEIVHIDLLDPSSLLHACEGVSTVVHLAAMNAQMSAGSPEKALMINGLGTLNLLTSSIGQGVERFIYFSTAHVYGSPLHGVINEKTLPRPIHPYSITHKLAEDYVLEADAKNKLSGTVLRLSNAIGSPSTKDTNCWMLVANDLCKQVIVNKMMKLHSPPHIKRDYLPISDICHVISDLIFNGELSLKAHGETINISNGTSISLDELSKLIAKRSESILGYLPRIEFPPKMSRPGIEDLHISNQKAIDLGLFLGTGLSDEIDALIINCRQWFGSEV